MSAKDVLAFAADQACVMVDFKFLDLPGQWQHFSVPISELDEGAFEDGFGFDGSSIRGWKAINESDMLVIPDPTTANIDPFMQHKTLSLICDIVDPITRSPYARDPRNVAKKAVNYMKSTGVADTVYVGPEAEFFVFDDVRFEQTRNSGFYHLDSEEGTWNSGNDGKPWEGGGANLGHKPRWKGGYFPVAPIDTLQDLRTDMCLTLQSVGIHVEAQHHEVATAGQCEIDMRFTDLVSMGDQLMWFKYIIKNCALRAGKTATFMPKPLFEDNGSGMHTHQSLWKNGQPLFAGNEYAGLSQMALWYIGGILKHGKALNAFTNPTTNSYKRLVPGFEAPVNLAYSSRNRSASIRIPMYSDSPKAKRIEVRFPDPTANGYLAFAAMLMAGLDGIENQIDPGEPMTRDIYGLSAEERKGLPTTAGSLAEALEALGRDHEFLLKGDVFTSDLVHTWIDYKTEEEVDPIRLRPTPYEFMLYYDI